MLLGEFKVKLQKIIDHIKEEVASLRTGRATPALVEDLEVECYGAKTPLKALASISAPEARLIVIQPWDKGALQPVEHAIRASNLGLNPVVDRDVIRLAIPSLTEERRKDLVKILGKQLEEGKIQVRREREEMLKEIDLREKQKEISEDQKFRDRAEAQKYVDEANKKIEELGAAKEKEITTI